MKFLGMDFTCALSSVQSGEFPEKDCLLPLISKLLGYCIVAASTTVKLPQVNISASQFTTISFYDSRSICFVGRSWPEGLLFEDRLDLWRGRKCGCSKYSDNELNAFRCFMIVRTNGGFLPKCCRVKSFWCYESC